MPKGEEEEVGTGWKVLGLGILGLVFIITRVGSHSYPWNEPGCQAGPGDHAGANSVYTSRYEPGSYGAFWENEERAARGVPGAVASPGLMPSREFSQRVESLAQEQGSKAQQLEIERQRAELEQLRRELDAMKLERAERGF
ncbi:MAG: hypothetical protein AMXMBFR7_36790 [Planctomycetota bacterium]